jgi:hypothetical protein
VVVIVLLVDRHVLLGAVRADAHRVALVPGDGDRLVLEAVNEGGRQWDLVFGRIVASEKEAPNMLVNLV